MSEMIMPDLKRIVGALIFGADRPIKPSEIRKCLKEAAESGAEGADIFSKVTEKDIRNSLEELRNDIDKQHPGFVLNEVAGGFRYLSDASCGLWLKMLLNVSKPRRLSPPSLETLAIVAYRQPVTKATIESVRGVSVDYILKNLMEMQLVSIVGRSELPGRPFLYGTTRKFLEHFGLHDINDLEKIEPMLFSLKEETSSTKVKNRKKAEQVDDDELLKELAGKDNNTQESTTTGTDAVVAIESDGDSENESDNVDESSEGDDKDE